MNKISTTHKHQPKYGYILVCCVEREINEPIACETYEEAFAKMCSQFADAVGCTFKEVIEAYPELPNGVDNEDAGINDFFAWCTSKWHNNTDWKIFAI